MDSGGVPGRVWRIAQANQISESAGLAQYSVIEQRHTYLRPRHGADFGPQICINDDLRDYSRQRGLTMIGYSILLQGAYTRPDREIPAQYAGADADSRLDALRGVASEVGATPNQVIIAWMLQSDPAVLPIIAGSRPEHVQENLSALGFELTMGQMERLNTAGNPAVKKAWLR